VLNVTLRAEAGWLTLEKRRLPGAGTRRFRARLPLAALVEARIGPPAVGLGGSSVALSLSSGDELVLDVVAGREGTGMLAQRLEDAAEAARLGGPPADVVFEVLGDPQTGRPSSGRAVLLMAATFVPFAFALVGGIDGPFAATTTLAVFLVAIVLTLVRPGRMARVLAVGTGLSGAAFLLDALRSGQAVRLAGALGSAVLAAWMWRATGP
jgi:hypothetical protein